VRLHWGDLGRHVAGDWGDVREKGRRENELSLIHGFRLLSGYSLNSGIKIWITTEADYTLELFPGPNFLPANSLMS
jgi:hypothetical protein